MTRRKFLLLLLILILVSQVPFAYRRYRLRRLRNAIQQLAAQRINSTYANEYVDYTGVIHVHTFLGGHSTGTFEELLAAAKTNNLDFVIMTEHPQRDFDTSAMTLNGLHDDLLFVDGNEVVTANGDRLLLIPGAEDANVDDSLATQEVVNKQKASGGLVFAAYPTESGNWQSTAVDGVEVYNLYTNARQINKLVAFFDGVWSYRSYADLMFANFFVRPAENLKRWDDAISATNRRLVAIAGNDAHSNVGFGISDATGKQWLGVKLDPYERSFRTVRVHVFIKKDKTLKREALLEALSLGHCYVSFDLFGDPKGFTFATKNSGTIMGDETTLTTQTELQATSPIPCRFLLLKNGAPVDEKQGTTVQFVVTSPGSYRVEAIVDSLPRPAQGQPWIISNPIYVK